jgi:hypothetical protein
VEIANKGPTLIVGLRAIFTAACSVLVGRTPPEGVAAVKSAAQSEDEALADAMHGTRMSASEFSFVGVL